MADTYSFESLLNTTAGMTAIINNSKQDDNTVSVTGVDWFIYAGKTTSTIYVSGNNWIGFGQNAEQLKICRRDGAVYYIYRQEGTLDSGKKFLKIRVKGYTYYSSTASSYALEYEIFLIEGQILFINVISRPTNSSYIGTSSITDETTTTTLTITTSTSVPIYILVKNAGSAQEVSYEKYSDVVITGISVATLPDKTTYYQKELFDSTGMVVTAVTSTGGTVEITDYEISGFDSETAGTKTVTVTYCEFTATFEITVLDETLTGITITTLPSKTQYHINGTFDPTGITASASTSDGNAVALNSDQLEYSDVDSSSPGSKVITVSYSRMTTTFDVTIMAPTSIQVEKYSGTAYFVGDNSSVRVYSISVTYSDGTDSGVENGYTITQVDTSTAGEKTAVVDYFGVTVEIPVTVLDSFSTQIGTPNKEDVAVVFDLVTGIMSITGAGEFSPIQSAENVPNSIITRVKILNIGEGITKIPDMMFPGTNVNNLEQVLFPNTLEEIGSGNFDNSKITQLALPNSLKKIGNYCFVGSIITSLEIPSSVTTIGSNSFADLPNLQSITFHEGLESIEPTVFNGCPLIKNLVLPPTLKNMQYNFQNSTLESLEMGGDNVNFSSSGSERISNISAKSMTIRSGTIDNGAFYYNTTIENLSLGETVKWNGSGQFNGCSNLTNVSISDGITSVPESCFRGCSSLDNVVLPDSITEIGENVFSGCTSLKNITLSKSLKAIPSYCFSKCAFESFSIPDDSAIETLGDVLFQNCSNLTSVYIGKNVKSIGNGCFYGANSLATIRINQKEDSISGSPWAASNAVIEWLSTIVTNIEIISLPAKTKYKKNEVFQSLGLTVKAYYDDGTSEEVTDYTLSSPEMTSTGTKTVTVTYKEKTATFEITVVDTVGIEVTELPKIRYYEDDTFSPDGIVVSLVYTDDSREEVTGYSLSSPDMSTGGEKTVTVTYKEFTATFTITVIGISGIEITKEPSKKEYYVGNSLDTAGMTVALKYTDGTSKSLTGYTTSGFDSSAVGEKTVTIAYKTHTATFKVTVYSASGIRIARSPNKVFYKNGESLDLTGISVMLIRNDGSEEEITDYETSGFDSSKAGAKNVTVFYNKVINGINTYVGSDTFQIKVTKDGTNPFEDSTEPIEVVVHWIDGEFKDLTSENNNIKSNTLVLQESICSESYFIFGGCISNQISFEVEHEQFYGTDEDSYPSGRIEVYLECKETKLKIFTGRIASAERTSIWSTRKIVAYDYLYDLRNTDIARWYKNQTTDKNKILTQKEFRDKLFEFLGIEQVPTTLHWDKTYVPNTQNANEMNVVNILKDLCLQNDRFGHMTRDGKFEYLKLRQNSYEYGETVAGKKLYRYYDNAEVHLDTFKSFSAQEGRIWFPHTIFTDPEPSRAYGFTQGDLTAQEAYENNVFYNRNSFFVGNEDWMNLVWDADEYGQISREKPIMDICYGTFVNLDLRKFYRAQAYTAEVVGNPFNTVGQTIELRETRQMEDGTELEWYVHSYIMSRTLRLGNSKLIDTYSANNAPFNSNSRQLGKDTPEISATVNRTRAELPVVSYEFTDGSDFSSQSAKNSGTKRKLVQLRCLKQMKYDDYKDLPEEEKKSGTVFYTYEDTK